MFKLAHPDSWLPAAALAAALAAGTALAADAPAPAKPAAKPATKAADGAPGTLSKGSPTLPTLTRDQLRQCMTEQERTRKESAELAQAQARIEQERAEIERLGKELEADKAKIDTSNEAAVNAYNERLRLRAKMIEDFKAGAPVFNQRVEKLGVDRQAYAAACADRRFFEEDYDAIKAGK